MSTELSEDERELRHTPDSSVFTSCSLIDKNGSSTELKSLLSPSSTLLLVFVRHWGCAACQEYITVLSKHLNRDDLAKYRASVVIVGHGKYTLIENYRKITGTTFDIYTTPDRTIHDKLGFGQMTFTSIFTNPLPGYSDKSNLSIIGTALKRFPQIGCRSEWGDDKQLGGEYILRTDENGDTRCIFGRRMPNSRNHTMPDELLKEIKAVA